MNRPTYGEMDRLTDGQSDRQRQMDSQVDKDKWTVRQTKADGQTNRWRDAQTDRWTHGERIRPSGRLTDRQDYTRS